MGEIKISTDNSNPKTHETSPNDKFIEWTLSRKSTDWDVLFVSGLIGSLSLKKGLDVGGGVGVFAEHVAKLQEGTQIDVIEPGTEAHGKFRKSEGIKLIKGYFPNIKLSQKYDFVLFNLVLHHMLDENHFKTRELQRAALREAAKILKKNGVIVVQENIYDPLFGRDLSGRLIYYFTRSKIFEKIFRRLGANTAGEGVSFNSDKEWEAIMTESGLSIEQKIDNLDWSNQQKLYEKLVFLIQRRYQRVYYLRKSRPIN
ncbi:class I SAM-dependent methyltransferase [Alphaproteobacteria bacterium]|nr:class I SAM-dependent methyltransferase [Alphaproteobacteria bacterium]